MPIQAVYINPSYNAETNTSIFPNHFHPDSQGNNTPVTVLLTADNGDGSFNGFAFVRDSKNGQWGVEPVINIAVNG